MLSQIKSTPNTVNLEGKTVNCFIIDLPQKFEFIQQLFSNKFDLKSFGNPNVKIHEFTVFKQIKLPKVTSNFVDFYYSLKETKTDNGSFVKITVIISKGYDNYISLESDANAFDVISQMLDEIDLSVIRKNCEIQIQKKESEVQDEKEKILMLEEELIALVAEKLELQYKYEKSNFS